MKSLPLLFVPLFLQVAFASSFRRRFINLDDDIGLYARDANAEAVPHSRNADFNRHLYARDVGYKASLYARDPDHKVELYTRDPYYEYDLYARDIHPNADLYGRDTYLQVYPRSGTGHPKHVEITETAKEAVIGKEAHVIEEIVIQKGAHEHVEKPSDKVHPKPAPKSPKKHT